MKNNKPEIRFQGFDEEWEEMALGEMAGETYGGGTPKTTTQNYWNGVIPWFQSSDLTGDKLTGVVPRKHISDEGLKGSATKLIPENSIAIITRVGFGKLALMSFPYTTSQDFLSLSNLKTDKEFSVYAVYKKLQKELGTVQGTSIKGITKDELLSKSFFVPKELAEQTKIGTFFKHLDGLIALHQQQYDKQVIVKKAMLEKMFPKNGATVPEIRFKGFTGDWEEKTLGEMADSIGYGLNAAATDYDGVNKYIRITDIDDKSNELNISALTSPNADLTFSENYKLSEGDILFARTGASVGKSYYYKPADGLVYFAGFLIRIRLKQEFNTVFVFQNTLTSEYDNFIRLTSQRSGQPGVNAQEYSQYEIMVPTLSEQEKIGSYFQKLDNLLSLHQRELAKLKNIKKALLQKMFV